MVSMLSRGMKECSIFRASRSGSWVGELFGLLVGDRLHTIIGIWKRMEVVFSLRARLLLQEVVKCGFQLLHSCT